MSLAKLANQSGQGNGLDHCRVSFSVLPQFYSRMGSLSLRVDSPCQTSLEDGRLREILCTVFD